MEKINNHIFEFFKTLLEYWCLKNLSAIVMSRWCHAGDKIVCLKGKTFCGMEVSSILKVYTLQRICLDSWTSYLKKPRSFKIASTNSTIRLLTIYRMFGSRASVYSTTLLHASNMFLLRKLLLNLVSTYNNNKIPNLVNFLYGKGSEVGEYFFHNLFIS